jgi:hypothetical protein
MTGTRGGVGRIAAMVVGLALLMLLALAGEARAGTYEVAQCGWGIGAELDPATPPTEGEAFSLNPAACTPPPGSGPAGMKFDAGIAPDGALGIARARWLAPPGTSFTAAHLTWSGTPQPGNWQRLGADVGSEFHLLASSFVAAAANPVDVPIQGPAWAFEAALQCLLGGPLVGCTRSVPSAMRLSGLILTVEDPQPPQVRLGGPLPAPGWHRGKAALELGAEDVGAGVAGVAVTIDGAAVLTDASTCAARTIEGAVRAIKLQPCPPTATRSVEVDTAGLADGPHTLHACATDFGGAQGCAPDAAIEVDNSPPAIAFVAATEGRVAATVSDRYSGPASGTISMRRADSETWTELATGFARDGSAEATLTASLPDLSAGTYLFRAAATDAVGNTGTAQLRVSGSSAEVRRQVADGQEGGKAPVPRGGGGAPGTRGRSTHLTAYLARGARGGRADARPTHSGRGDARGLTVDFGTAVEVRGRLTSRDGGKGRGGADPDDADLGFAHDNLGLADAGAGIAGRSVTIVARPTAGIGRGPERRRVVTDRHGHFDLRLPAGVSRSVTVAFHGGRGLAATSDHPLALRVRAAVSLAAAPPSLRTGESVTLTGRLRPGPALLPARGKLVTVQYLEQASGRWQPALVTRTDARGRFKVSYRFRYVTGAARIRLRATALPEAGWPYASGSSAPVTVEVRG